MKLIIVESPHKAKTIEKYLGKEYKVLASAGHIRDLPEKKLGINVDKEFEIEYVLNSNKKDIINKLKKEVEKAEYVYLATDPDREGEAISWHLKEVLGIKDDKVRIEFNEVTKKAVISALNSPRSINEKLVNAQQARRVMDRLVGYKVSPVISKKIKNGLSAGRVQSVALKMITDREKEINEFKVEEYWNVYAFLYKEKEKSKLFKSTLANINGKKATIDNKDRAEEVLNDLNKAQYSVVKVKNSVTKSMPSPPFSTSTLQQDGSSKLSLSASAIMSLAQQLYEGLEIDGEGHTALVTYIRTDSFRVSQDAQIEAKAHIIDKYGEDYAPSKFNYYKSKGDSQDAHEAIRPISLAMTPESLSGKITRNHYRLYKLIYDRFVASQMTPALYDSLIVDINGDTTDNQYLFKLKGKSLKFEGYLKVYKNNDSEEDVENSKLLPSFKEKESLVRDNIKIEQKFTTPPPRYTDATLIKAMEENGIGRPSTYASILSVILKKEYAIKEQKFLMPTELGTVVSTMLVKYFPDIMNIKFTASMELKLDTIEVGNTWQNIIKDFYPDFIKSVKIAAFDKSKAKLKSEVSDTKCDKCGEMMVIKEGRYGKFLACPNYPECKNIKSYGEIVSTCPQCKIGGIMKRKSKAGKIYYSCNNYPECKFISWDVPAPYFCPKCNGILKTIIKKNVKMYVCVNKSCDYKEELEKDDQQAMAVGDEN